MKTLFVLIILMLMTFAVNAEKQPLPPMHHPVGLVLTSDMALDDEFPLGDKQELICDTCHVVDNIDKMTLDDVRKIEKSLLRKGPYPYLIDFCSHCHDAELKKDTMQRLNIHVLFDPKGHLIEDNCTFCHVSIPETDHAEDITPLEYHIKPEKLCYGCHLKTTHLNAVQHQVKPSDKVLKQLQKTENEKNIKLPLSAEGEVMCITCHSPHQDLTIKDINIKQSSNKAISQGIQYGDENYWSIVFSKDKKNRFETINSKSPLLEQPKYLPIHDEILLRLPAKDGTLCGSCHRFDD